MVGVGDRTVSVSSASRIVPLSRTYIGGGDRNRTGVQGFAGCSGRIVAHIGGMNVQVRRGARTSANTGDSLRPRDGRGMERVVGRSDFVRCRTPLRDHVVMTPPARTRRLVVCALAKTDEFVDEVLYRPAVVRAFRWVPRWWQCDLAKLSMALDDRWSSGWWADDAIAPGRPCEACGRRASVHVYGGMDNEDAPIDDYLATRPVYVCGWCHLRGPMASEPDVQRELAAARADSISWRWRWRVRD